MNKDVNLELYQPDKKTLEDIKELADAIGAEYTVKDLPYLRRSIVTLRYDQDAIKRKLNRNAGRKKVYLHNDSSIYIELNEVERRIKEDGAQKVAEDLGISRATLFRKIKKARDTGVEYVV